MKEIKAFIRAERAAEVLDALSEVGVTNATLTHVLAVGPNADPDGGRVSLEFGRRVNRMVKLEVVFPDRDEQLLVDVVRRAARTGRHGDGVVAVADVNRLVKIRDAAEGAEGS